MCTAATYKTKGFYFGRTLDYEFSYGEHVTITPRNYPIRLHGGALDIASAVGEGTTVTVTLPSAKAEEALGITGAPSRTEEEP